MDSSSFPNGEGLDNETADSGKQKAPDDPSGATSQPKKEKEQGERADVWDHFTKHKDNRDFCFCHYCQHNLSCPTKSGTSHLKRHLKTCKAYLAWLDGSQDNTQQQKQINQEGGLKDARVSKAVFDEACDMMLVIGELPLSFIESEAFKNFCSMCNLYQPHSRRTSTRNIVEMYVKRKAALKELFLSNKQRVSLTTDIWVASPTGASYMVITAHYIDTHWRLKKLIIGFKSVTDHKGQTISNVLLECLAEWGIKKVFCVTVDNATSNSLALRNFEKSFAEISHDSLVLSGEFLHMRCNAHILNLIVNDGLTDVSDSVAAIRNAVTYVRSTTNRLNSFDLKVDAARIKRGSLPMDVKTRWNSTYLMLTKAIKFKAAFQKMYAEDKPYNDYFLELDKGNKKIGPPEMLDWSKVERLEKFLAIFYESTLVVSGSTSVNSFKCYGEIVDICTSLRELSYSFDQELKKNATDMLKKFDKYWEGLKNMNKMLIVATVFDPRKKMKFAELCFDDLFGKETVENKEMQTSVKDILRSLFDEYSLRLEQSTERWDDDLDLVSSRKRRKVESRFTEMQNEKGVKVSTDELDVYLKESCETPDVMHGMEYDVLSWWKVNAHKYPILAEIARDVLAVQVSSVASESAFSTSGRIISPARSSLTHYMVEVLMCLDQWMKQDISLSQKCLQFHKYLLT
ncbi:hypothetical protein CARUB_v10006988mg [Capsella rubella]|uniref:BED-type domain-containing protein n=1 Tax=Capsella rubella TaxID=81985 RepID=R0H1F0_9BRAS|nr:hypothetical protein CARUB_v10006988mg [Capsella rubella]